MICFLTRSSCINMLRFRALFRALVCFICRSMTVCRLMHVLGLAGIRRGVQGPEYSVGLLEFGLLSSSSTSRLLNIEGCQLHRSLSSFRFSLITVSWPPSELIITLPQQFYEWPSVPSRLLLNINPLPSLLRYYNLPGLEAFL